MPKLQLEFDVEVDGDGIVDGRELGRYLTAVAFNLLVPYVKGCHACTDNLFTGIANEALEELHKSSHARGHLVGHLYRPGLPEDPEAIRRHLDAAEHTTRAMMAEDETHHLH